MFGRDGFQPVREAMASHLETKQGPAVVLVVPVSDFSVPDSRVDGYIRAVDQLLEVAGA